MVNGFVKTGALGAHPFTFMGTYVNRLYRYGYLL